MPHVYSYPSKLPAEEAEKRLSRSRDRLQRMSPMSRRINGRIAGRWSRCEWQDRRKMEEEGEAVDVAEPILIDFFRIFYMYKKMRVTTRRGGSRGVQDWEIPPFSLISVTRMICTGS